MSAFTRPILEFAERGVAKLLGTSGGEVASRYALESGTHALERKGPTSQMLVKILNAFHDTAAQKEGQVISSVADDFRFLKHDTPEATEYYTKLSTGKAASNPTVDMLAAKHSDLMDTLYTEIALKPNVKVGPRLSGPYWPRMYPSELYEGKHLDQAINHMIKTGQARNYDHARRVLGIAQKELAPVTGRFYNIEGKRTIDLPFLERKDPGVVLDYLAKGTRRGVEIDFFGQNGEVLNSLLSQIREESGEATYQYATNVTSQFLGHHPAGFVGNIERGVVAFETATKLGLSVLSNMFQPGNNLLVTGVRPVLEALAKRVTSPAEFQAFGVRSGAALMQTVHELRRVSGAELETLLEKPFRYTGFQRVETFNRVFSANIGKAFADDELGRLLSQTGNQFKARTNLQMLGVQDVDTAIRRGFLTDSELLTAGKRLSDITQFRGTALDLPPEWKLSPWVRLASLYKQFAFNQTKFMKDHVIKPGLRDGNWKPLITMAVIFPTFGEVAADLKTLARKGTLEQRPDWDKYPYDRIVDNMAHVGQFGVMMDVLQAATNGSPTATYSFLLGPVGTDIADILAIPKYGPTHAERLLLGKIPTIGPLVRETLAPNERQKKTKGPITKTLKNLF